MRTRFKADLAPIAVFAYNRRDHLATMLKSLERCEGFAHSPVVIFVDGPKGEADREAVDKVRVFVRGLKFPNVSHVISDENTGLRKSIHGGVSRLVDEHGRAIVLEDDLVLSPITLDYFNTALNFYAEDPRVWSVSGYIPDVPELREFPRALILPYAHSWGWATWDRAWRQFDLDNRPAKVDLNASAFRAAFDMNGLYPFTAQLKNSIAKRVNSWYIHWYYTIFQHGGCSIFPPRRVLDNYGISAGTHGSAVNPHERLVSRPALLTKVPEFASAGHVDYATLDLLKMCWELRVQRLIASAGAAKRRLRGRSG